MVVFHVFPLGNLISLSDPCPDTLFWHSFWHTALYISGIFITICIHIYTEILSGIYFDNLCGILSGIYSDIPSGILAVIYSSHFLWHLFWQSFWYSIGHLFWHTFWHIFCQSIWHLFWHSCHSICHFGMFSAPGVTHCIQLRRWKSGDPHRKARNWSPLTRPQIL